MAFLDPTAGIPFVMAHRGFSGVHVGGVEDENSLAAFDRALALGAEYLETDVRVTRDGVALAFHDAVLDRVTDAHGAVAGLTWGQVRQARISGVEPIPTLTDVLGSFPGARLNVDVKTASGVAPTVAAIRHAGAADRVCVGAFSDRRTQRLRGILGAAVTTALAPGEVLRLRALASAGPVAARVRPGWVNRAVQVPRRVGRLPFVDERLVRAAHRLGLPVHVWTVNDPVEMRGLLDIGVDALITDRLDLALEVIRTVPR